MDWLTDPQIWIGFLTLASLEIVLGIDNIVFISIIAGKLPAEQRAKARMIGLGLALVMRILFLLSISWIMRLEHPLFTVLDMDISGRDLILIVGGLFLVGKATYEIHGKLETEEHGSTASIKVTGMTAAIIQIVLIDLVFSIDSVITAVGMVKQVGVMIAAVVVSILFMLAFAGKVSDFLEKHPTLKMLALAFLVLIGFNLFAEGFGYEIPKGYTYFAMAFSLGVEALNIRLRNKQQRPTDPH
ncbi:MAG: TerC family protein [Fimbriimonadia bacterium]|nr:TerC family protein [Fimbriimonadia bacterium]